MSRIKSNSWSLYLGGPSDNQSREGIISLVLCPISGKSMADPVMAADGYTYERSAIEGYLKKTKSDGDLFSPVTGKLMTHRRLAPNKVVQAVASQYA
mmetsp:Transcript_13660/g.31755  ORF Transcript_13660/g.31755 Transcript_13660/m.31755 type:complete len:97 (+) Transcript_13660:209-499(+)